jgi:hypothetical protein
MLRQGGALDQHAVTTMRAPKYPTFSVNDRVLDRSHEKPRVGIVIKVYHHGGVYRYLVRFDDGSEKGLFGFELEVSNSG